MRLLRMIVLVIAIWTGSAGSLLAAMGSAVRSLVGVREVQVVVEDFNAATQKTGLRKEQIQNAAESYLAQHGVNVVRGSNRAPLIYVRLSSVIGGESERAPISFYLNVQVKQLARLARTHSAQPVTLNADEAPLLVTTWEDGAMVMLARAELHFYVQQVLVNLLASFVQDYQQANEANGKPGE
ncbi:MAG TPA: hypothetical protein VNN62_27495 [Methylomirabilota bacterium]|nr:hypothetical protein [Methylomirabilota bacterium]